MTAFSDDDEDGGATFAFWHFRFTDLPETKNYNICVKQEKKSDDLHEKVAVNLFLLVHCLWYH